MRFVEAARFMDTPEALVASSALRASGIPCFVQNEGVCQNVFTLQIAFGGYRIWVPEKDVEDVRTFIAASRGVTPHLSHIWPSAGILQTMMAVILWVCTGAFVPLRFGPQRTGPFEGEDDVNSQTTLAT